MSNDLNTLISLEFTVRSNEMIMDWFCFQETSALFLFKDFMTIL